MKIMLLTTHIDTGGIGVYTVTLAEALTKRGHGVIIASSGGDLEGRLKNIGIEHITLDIRTKSEMNPHVLTSSFKLRKILKRTQFDLIHAQTRVTQVIASNVSKFSKLPVVTTCHGFFKKRLGRILFPCWGSRVIAISEAVKNHLIKDLSVKEDIIRVIHNGIDMNKFCVSYNSVQITEFKRQFGLKDGPVIGIIARLSSVKGHKFLIEAFSKVLKEKPAAQLFIAGSGPEEKKLIDLVNNLGIAKNVIFQPPVSDTTKPLSVMDIFVMPSIQEGLGLSIIEAMALGKPVIATDVGGISTLVKDRKTGLLVPPHDPDKLADAILNLLEDKLMRQKIGLNAKEYVRENFKLEDMASKVENVYREVLGENK